MQYKTVEVYGDSILRGVQLDDTGKRYKVDNNIDIGMLEEKFHLKISNFSKFGCTITKAVEMIERRFKSDKPDCDAIVMNLGGNDCDFNWKAVAEDPVREHEANTPLPIFTETYRKIIETIKNKGIKPIVTTLPPLDAHRFFNWFCGVRSEQKANVLKWLGDIGAIYRWQENYSRTIERLAEETGTLLVDLRGAFLRYRKLEPLLCADGTHPNTEGQKVITQGFLDFILSAKRKGTIALYA